MKEGQVYGRYTITHKDGKPLDPARRLFVLSPDSDPHAAKALAYYAEVCRETHPELSQSIRETYELPDAAPSPELEEAT